MKNRKAFTVEADEELSKAFSEQVDGRGYTKYRAIEGAIRLWLTLTPHEQVELIEGKPKPESSDEDLDEEIRAFARSFAVLTQKLERRASANAQKKPQRKSATG